MTGGDADDAVVVEDSAEQIELADEGLVRDRLGLTSFDSTHVSCPSQLNVHAWVRVKEEENN